MAKKKKPASNPARGFATTSVASKAKPVVEEPPPEEPTVEALAPAAQDAEEWKPPTAEEEAEEALRSIVEKHGVKVRKESARIIAKFETEKRTLRNSNMCYPLKLDRILGIDSARYAGTSADDTTLGETILQMARQEMTAELEKKPKIEEVEDKMLVQTWTLHRVLLGLGFKKERVEESVKTVLSREGRVDRDVEMLLDEVMEWMALFCEPDEIPRYLEAPISAPPKKAVQDTEPKKETPEAVQKKPINALGGNRPPIRTPAQAPSQGLRPKAPGLQPASLSSEISNLQLESLDISDQGEDLTCSSDGSASSDDEVSPDSMVPTYLRLQTRLYNIHPSVASVITGGKKVKGGGKKPTKLPPGIPPGHLSLAKKKKVKTLQGKLSQLERDPLFDSYIADTAWRDERAKLDEEAWLKKQQDGVPEPDQTKATKRSTPKPVVEDDGGMLGGLFEGPPTEEQVGTTGENIRIRDFEESASGAPKVNMGGPVKPGVGAALLRKMVQEICKSRDVNAQVRFEQVAGTALSCRCRMFIVWTTLPELDIPPPPAKGEPDERDVVIKTPNTAKPTTIFEMKNLGAATKDQAEGFIITYALFKLFAKKDEKLYIRLPTIWKYVWAELAEDAKNKSEGEERKVLETLRDLLKKPAGEENVEATMKAERLPKVEADEGLEEDEDTSRKQKPSYERYLEGDLLREQWEQRRQTPAFQQMEQYRSTLPMWGFRQEILDTLEANPVVVLCGETGCGKSTQLPAFLLEHELMNGKPCKIYCTEPRRISALSLAKRVAEELGEGKGRVGGLVGYSIRLENMVTDQTRLIYATTGIVMRMLERTPDLADVTHLVLDEVHERSIESDFLMVVLKRLLVKRKDLKVVLMSATVNAERFSDYLGGAPILRVPGRTFPVQELYLEDAVELTGFKAEDGGKNAGSRNMEDNDADLEDPSAPIGTDNLRNYSPQTRSTLSKMDERQIPYDLILQLLEKIATSPQYKDFSKAILVFLPGLGEIRRLNDMIMGHPAFGHSGRNQGAGGWLVYPLHSTIASEEQEAAFLIPPRGMRKIVLATNIAETGITIPDVTAVIDTGKHKEMRFDEKRQLSRLIETYISRANAKQRRGRAGRVQAGICWHLFTKDRYEQSMADQQTPEIMRLSLQDLCLRVKICGLGNVEEVLTSALDSPTTRNIRRAVESLVDVKALTAGEELTPLGRQLAKLPLDVYLGKLVLLGSLFCCLDATVTIAALLTSKSPFISPIGYGAEANSCRLSFKRGDSDLLTGFNAYSIWRRVCTNRTVSEAEFCRKNYLSSRTLSGIEDLKTQLFASLVDAGFLNLSGAERQQLSRARYSSYRRTFFMPPDHCSINSTNDSIVSATISAAFYPKLLARDGRGWRNILSNGKLVRVHHNSVNSAPPTEDADWLAYYSLMQTRNGGYDAHETTCVQSFVVALLCGDAEWRLWSGVMSVDGNRIRFALPDWRYLVAVKALRRRVREIVNRAWKAPDRKLSEGQEKWLKAFWDALETLEKKKE